MLLSWRARPPSAPSTSLTPSSTALRYPEQRGVQLLLIGMETRTALAPVPQRNIDVWTDRRTGVGIERAFWVRVVGIQNGAAEADPRVSRRAPSPAGGACITPIRPAGFADDGATGPPGPAAARTRSSFGGAIGAPGRIRPSRPSSTASARAALSAFSRACAVAARVAPGVRAGDPVRPARPDAGAGGPAPVVRRGRPACWRISRSCWACATVRSR